MVAEHEGDGGPHDAHEHHVVDTHAYVLGVVEGGDAHVSSLPRQERSEDLQPNKPLDISTQLDLVECVSFHVRWTSVTGFVASFSPEE